MAAKIIKLGRKQKAWLTVAVLHLILVGYGASQRTLPPHTSAARAFNSAFGVYGPLSGAQYGYSYFAPEISGDVRARFFVTRTDGTTFADTLDRGNRETSLRIGNIVGLIPQTIDEPQLRRQVATSWAAAMFSRHEQARKIKVEVEEYALPSLAEWRTGNRPFWRSLYSASFVRHGEPTR